VSYFFRQTVNIGSAWADFSGWVSQPLTGWIPIQLPFHDVSPADWFYHYVWFVYDMDWMRGTSTTTFEPYAPLTRAMVATIIYRMEGEPYVPFRPIFSDVPADRWYSEAVTWAYETGIVQGMGDNRFAPHDLLTREQLSAMMHRFARYRGLDLSVPSHITAPSGTSQWAQHYVRWAVYHNFIPTTNPSAVATRAETAIFVHQFGLRLGN